MNDLQHAVVVGINRYPGIGDLAFARADAFRFRDWLISPHGGDLPPENVELVTVTEAEEQQIDDVGNARPTQREVNDALKRRRAAVAGQVGPADPAWASTRLYFYVAGHGFAPADGVTALLLADAAQDELGYHIELHRYQEWLVECAPFREVIIFADCCRRQVEDAPLSTPVPFNRCQLQQGVEVVSLIGYATRKGDDALEPLAPASADDARGVFTRALIEGLDGAAADGDGEISAASLAGYVRSTVESRTVQAPVPQRVEFPADLTQAIVLRRIGPPPTRRVTLRFPLAAHGPANVVSGAGLTVTASADAGAGTWTVELSDGFYEVQPGEGASGFDAQLFKVHGEDCDVVVT